MPVPRRVFCQLDEETLAEIKAQADRLERSYSWMAQLAWRIAKRRMERLSSLTELRIGPKGAA